MENLNEIFEELSPILIKPTTTSITIGLSKRFFLFEFFKKLMEKIEEDPYLNFIAVLKSYKLLGKFQYGTLSEFYHQRNQLYFSEFFHDKALYNAVKKDIESLYPRYKDIKMTISKNGVITYDNYKVRGFNVLLLTIHSGSWVPKEIAKKFEVSKKKMHIEEDIGTDRLYREIVLENGGIWIDNKQSRFVIDFNRPIEKAIYSDNSEPWIATVWKSPPTKKEIEQIQKSYVDFHITLSQLIDTYNFNIILDAHSMNNLPGRPGISFGIEFIPKFYMPIVKNMKKTLEKKGYGEVLFNIPYKGGYILQSLRDKFPYAFTCTVEVNKKLYMEKTALKPIQKKLIKVKKDIYSLFDLPK